MYVPVMCMLLTCCYLWLLLCQLCASHACNALPEAAVQLAAIVPKQLADIVAVVCFPLDLQHTIKPSSAKCKTCRGAAHLMLSSASAESMHSASMQTAVNQLSNAAELTLGSLQEKQAQHEQTWPACCLPHLCAAAPA